MGSLVVDRARRGRAVDAVVVGGGASSAVAGWGRSAAVVAVVRRGRVVRIGVAFPSSPAPVGLLVVHHAP